MQNGFPDTTVLNLSGDALQNFYTSNREGLLDLVNSTNLQNIILQSIDRKNEFAQKLIQASGFLIDIISLEIANPESDIQNVTSALNNIYNVHRLLTNYLDDTKNFKERTELLVNQARISHMISIVALNSNNVNLAIKIHYETIDKLTNLSTSLNYLGQFDLNARISLYSLEFLERLPLDSQSKNFFLATLKTTVLAFKKSSELRATIQLQEDHDIKCTKRESLLFKNINSVFDKLAGGKLLDMMQSVLEFANQSLNEEISSIQYPISDDRLVYYAIGNKTIYLFETVLLSLRSVNIVRKIVHDGNFTNVDDLSDLPFIQAQLLNAIANSSIKLKEDNLIKRAVAYEKDIFVNKKNEINRVLKITNHSDTIISDLDRLLTSICL